MSSYHCQSCGKRHPLPRKKKEKRVPSVHHHHGNTTISSSGDITVLDALKDDVVFQSSEPERSVRFERINFVKVTEIDPNGDPDGFGFKISESDIIESSATTTVDLSVAFSGPKDSTVDVVEVQVFGYHQPSDDPDPTATEVKHIGTLGIDQTITFGTPVSSELKTIKSGNWSVSGFGIQTTNISIFGEISDTLTIGSGGGAYWYVVKVLTKNNSGEIIASSYVNYSLTSP